jgi:cysteinyl-tRNA synthetase
MMGAGPTADSTALSAKVLEMQDKFMDAMRDDFNTALAISYLFALAKEINVYKSGIEASKSKPDGKLVDIMNHVWKEMCGIIGIFEDKTAAPKDAAADQEEAKINELVAKRQAARKAKNYAEADAIRKQLTDMGIILEDTPQGPKWKKQ